MLSDIRVDLLPIDQLPIGRFFTEARKRYPATDPLLGSVIDALDFRTAFLESHIPKQNPAFYVNVDPRTERGMRLARVLNTCVIRPTDFKVTGRLAGMPQFSLDFWLLKGMVPYAQVDIYQLVRSHQPDSDPLSEYGVLKPVGFVGYGYGFDPYNLPDIIRHPRSLNVNLGTRSGIEWEFANDTVVGGLVERLERAVICRADKLIDEKGDKILTKRVSIRGAAWMAEKRVYSALIGEMNRSIWLLQLRDNALNRSQKNTN